MPVSRLTIPILVIVALFGGYFLRLAFTQPTTLATYGQAEGEKATFVVDGVKCKGTAAYFTSMYENVPGVIAIETFATEHKAIFTYDASVINRDSIIAIMEAPVQFEDGTSAQIFKCLSVE